MEIIFSLHNGLPVSALGEGSVAVSSPGFPIPVRQWPNPVEKWVPRLLKGPTCQRSRGISHSQPPYCSPGHNGLHGARPFVINSVVNFCWGNKSVTHLQLWIRSSFFTLLFLLSCLYLFLHWHIAHGSVGHIKSDLEDKKEHAFLVNTRSNGGQDTQHIFLFFITFVLLCTEASLWFKKAFSFYFYFNSLLICWNDLCCFTGELHVANVPTSPNKCQEGFIFHASVLFWHPCITFNLVEKIFCRGSLIAASKQLNPKSSLFF